MVDSGKVFLKVSIIYLTLVFTASCSSLQFKTNALNYAASVDGIYSTPDTTKIVNVVSEWEFQRLLRDDFNFRYNYAQYAQTLPITWHYSNRIMRGNRYNMYHPYYSYINRHQMWNDWVWNYPYVNGIGGSYSWNNNSWSSNSWNSPYGWNNYYGWGNGYNYYGPGNHWNYRPNYNRRPVTSYVIGRRGSTIIESIIRTNINRDDKTIRHYPRRAVITAESSDNGWRSRSRQDILTKPVIIKQPRTVQPRQVHRRPKPPVLQQPRSSSQTNNQGRTSSSRKKN